MILLSKQLWTLPWYLMPVSEQKSYLWILIKSQQSAVIQLPFIGPLNMETYTDASFTDDGNFKFIYFSFFFHRSCRKFTHSL